jgi:hypothetical protein
MLRLHYFCLHRILAQRMSRHDRIRRAGEEGAHIRRYVEREHRLRMRFVQVNNFPFARACVVAPQSNMAAFVTCCDEGRCCVRWVVEADGHEHAGACVFRRRDGGEASCGGEGCDAYEAVLDSRYGD